MNNIIFILGGCRSGKSSYALECGQELPGSSKIFLATCVPRDQEMQQRVERHQQERDHIWRTLEVPLKLPEAIAQNSRLDTVILVDCLTLWINNLLMESQKPDAAIAHAEKLVTALKQTPGTVILVSNEVGAGIVPENQLARLFRDVVGTLNQKVAQCAHKVIWMAAGIPVTIKDATQQVQGPS